MLTILRHNIKRAVSTLSSNGGKYLIREAVPTDYMAVTKLRAPEFNVDLRTSQSEVDEAELFDLDFNNLAQSCQEANFFCYVAVPEDKKVENCHKYVEHDVIGAVDLLLRVDPVEAHYGLVPPLWMEADPTKQACITNLAVAREMRRLGVAKNLLKYALGKAKDAGMEQVYASVDKNNGGVVELNKKVGFQLLVDDKNVRDFIMGIKL